jgi:hypothetical protein
VAEYVSGMTATIVGTSARPTISIAGSSTVSGILTRITAFNTTATACTYRLVRYTGGTAGVSQTEAKKRLNAPASTCSVQAGHTVDIAGGAEDTGYRIAVPGAIGAGASISLDSGVETPISGTTPGLGLIPVGTGQICDWVFEFYE